MSMRALPWQRSGKRLVLLVAAGFLSASALLAVGILLFGSFGETEGRILGTTALLAGFALLALPAALLLDRGRLPWLAAAGLALAVTAAGLATASIWSGGGSETLGRAVGTACAWLAVVAQASALSLRRTEADSRSVRGLFAASAGLSLAAASLLTALIWHGGDGQGWARAIGSLVVLDVLAAALQPILALARPRAAPVRLRLRLASGAVQELRLEAPDLATAAARAIRMVERDGARVAGLEVVTTAGGGQADGANVTGSPSTVVRAGSVSATTRPRRTT